ncbi:hypothetical protein DB30_00992 [Enhygromyxa salina]|uniref:Uncharacterized protein n=1 Tax=Enhygromyxa salina TaxID=215803 RepID=A0A0C1Z5F1_9BACT|nr:hypothetical protein DB30_00992 [Enhygromyxa salina]
MPPWIEREVVASFLLNVGGAWRWMSGAESSLAKLPAGIGTARPEDDELPLRSSRSRIAG